MMAELSQENPIRLLVRPTSDSESEVRRCRQQQNLNAGTVTFWSDNELEQDAMTHDDESDAAGRGRPAAGFDAACAD